MPLPLSYSLRNLRRAARTQPHDGGRHRARRRGACSLFLGLISSLKRTLVSSGDPLNLVVMRKGSDNDGSSQLSLEAYQAIRFFDGIARDATDQPAGLARAGRAALLPHPQRRARERAGARRRAGGARGARQVRIVEGRMFTPSAARRSSGAASSAATPAPTLGNELRVRARHVEGGGHLRCGRLVVRERGVGRRARAGQRREADLSPTPASACAPPRRRTWRRCERRIDDDPRYALEAQRETDYYAKQSESANSLYVLVIGIAVLAGIGAGFGAANTMYAAVQARTAEIGTLRALGFSRGAILVAFEIEAVALALLGFLLGAACSRSASPLLVRVLLGGVAFGAATFTTNVITLRVGPRICAGASSSRCSSASSAASARPGAPRACGRSKRCGRRECSESARCKAPESR